MRPAIPICLVLALGTAFAGEEPPGEKQTVEEWAGDLASESVETRRAAAWALWQAGDPAAAAAEPLARAVVDEDEYVRKTTLAVLNRLGAKARVAIPVLESLIGGRAEEEVRRLAWLAVRLDPVGAFESELPAVRIAAAEEQMRPGEKTGAVVQGLLALLEDEVTRVRTCAANALGMPGTPGTGDLHGKTAEALLGLLAKDPESEVRVQAAGALGWIENAKSVAGLVDALSKAAGEDADVEVRKAAILGLRIAGPTAKPAVPALVRALGDPDAGIRGHAAIALGALAEPTETVLSGLAGALEDWDQAARSYAAGALAAFGAKAAPAADALVACYREHDDRRTRMYVVQALAEVGEPARVLLPQLVADFEGNDAPPDELAYALCRLRADCAEDALARLATVAVTDAPGRAQFFLRRLGPEAKAALPALEEGLSKAPEELKEGIRKTIEAIRGE